MICLAVLTDCVSHLLGRPKVSTKVENSIKELRSQGMGMLKIAKTVGCGVSVVQRVLTDA